jgi:phage tail sheath protein FI
MAEKGDLDIPALVTNWNEFVEKFGRYTSEKPYLAPSVHGFFVNGGRRCYVIRVKDNAKGNDYIGLDRGPGGRTGLQAFNEVDEVSIVCIPGVTLNKVQKAMIIHCETMKDRICILDTAQDANMDAIRSQKGNVVSEGGYAALYFPWIKVAIETVDISGNVKVIQDFVPPSGYIAGVYARTDVERGVHKAPANEIIRGATGVKRTVTKREQDILNRLGVNSIRKFSGRGIRIWGARTTASDDLWKYVNVRRLFLFLEESIDKGTQWVVFEPDDKTLWSRVKQTITQFLTSVWRDGALTGTTPQEAFFVKCDRTTMTQDDIDNGRLIILIGVAPIKPAEFVIFRIAQQAGSLEVSDRNSGHARR